MTVVAYVPDLMDRSKVAAAATCVRRGPGALLGTAADADVVVVDLGRSGVLDGLPALVATGAGWWPSAPTSTGSPSTPPGPPAARRPAPLGLLPPLPERLRVPSLQQWRAAGRDRGRRRGR